MPRQPRSFDPVEKWIERDKNGLAFAALLVQSRIALVVTIVLGIMVVASVVGPGVTAAGAAIGGALQGIRYLKSG